MVEAAVRQVTRKELVTIYSHSTAQEAAKRMRSKKVSSLVVIEKGDAPVGIVTERDLVRSVCSRDISSDSVLIQEIMSSPIVTIDVDASIEQAADKMIQNKVRHLLITENDKIYGIITPSDFTIYLTENLNMDEVNARILQSLKEDMESQ
jgi:CBS domain-containing protein